MMVAEATGGIEHSQLFGWLLRVFFALAAVIIFWSTIQRWRREPTLRNAIRIGLLLVAFFLIAFAILVRKYGMTG